MPDITEQVRSFIFENFLFDEDAGALKNDDSFLEKGIIDSTGVLELVGWLEDTYGIQVDDKEMIPDNLDSVEKIAVFVGKKTGKGS